MFCCSWTTYLEQLTCQSARQGNQLHRIQKTTENIHVSDGLRRIVTFLIIAPYKYSYLLTYVTTWNKLDHHIINTEVKAVQSSPWHWRYNRLQACVTAPGDTPSTECDF